MTGWDLRNLAEAKLKLKHANARWKRAREAALDGPFMGSDGRITDKENAAQVEEDCVSELSLRVAELEERSQKTMAAALKNVENCRSVSYRLIVLVSYVRKVSTTVADLIESANNLSKQLALLSSSIAAAGSVAKQAGSAAASAAKVEAEAEAEAKAATEEELLQTRCEEAYIAIDDILAYENPNYTLMNTTAEFLVVGSPVAKAAVKAAKTAEKATKTASEKAAKKKAAKRKAAAASSEKISDDDIQTESEPEEENAEVDNKPAKRVCNWTDHD
jgi:hypothetical protein